MPTGLPPGLGINASTGVISGTPVTAGAYTFTVKATDAQGNVGYLSEAITITGAALSGSLADGTVGISYSSSLTATGTQTPNTWSISVGTLPPGLAINSSSGVVSGTPTTVGTYAFTVRVIDSNWGPQTVTKAESVDIQSADPYAAYVIALLHTNGSHNGTSFPDVVSSNTWSRSGSPVTSTTQVKYGTAAAYFPGSARLSAQTDALFKLDGDLCIEGWYWASSARSGSDQQLVRNGPPDPNHDIYMKINTVGNFQCYLRGFTGTVSSTYDGWHHFAVVLSGSTFTIYIDGVGTLISASVGAANAAATRVLELGEDSRSPGSDTYLGYIDDLRITKGHPRYTTNFTPPTTELPDV